MKRKLFCLLTLLLAVCSGAWADPTYKSDFTNNQIIWTTKSAVDDAITNGWMVKGGKVTGTKNLKNRLLIDPTTNEVSTSAQFTSDTNFYVEKAYNSTLSNDYSLYIYVTGVTRLYFYVWSNSTPDGRSMNIYLNGSNDASATITYPNESEPRNGYAYVDLTSSVNNVIRLSASNELELYAIKAQTPTELAISTHPTSAEYASGASAAALTVAATGGTKPYTYQWYSCADAEKSSPSALTSDDEIAKGSQTASYTPSTTATGYYYCKVTDSATPTSAEVESNVATITISAASAPTKPTITGGPAEAVAKNTAVTLTASSTGLPSPTYQWYSNTAAVATVDEEHKIDGATEASYSPSTAAIGTKYYYVVASNSEGYATSDVVSVEVVGSNACELLSIQFSNSAYGAISSLTEGAGTITVPYLSGESAPTVNESSSVISDNATEVVEGNTVTVTAEDGTTTGVYTITKTAFTPLEVTGDIETETFTAVPTWVYNHYGWDNSKGVKFAKDDNESGGTRRISLGNTRQYYFISAAQTLTLTSGSASGKGINVYRNGVKLATPTATASTDNSIDIALDPSAPCMIMIESKGNNGDGGFTKYAVTAAVAKYDVNIAAMTNGNVTADVDEAAEGETVTLTVTPADGYALSTLTVTKADESTVATSEVDATHYTFSMPAEAVTVSATFVSVPTYTITIPSFSNGSVTASPSPAVAGATVTLTVSPADGYELNSLTVTGDTSSDEVTITDNQFTMPAENVTVAATFSEVVVPVSDEVTFDLKNASFVVSDPGTTQDGINFQSTLSPGASYLNDGNSSGGHTITISASGSKRISRIVFTFTAAQADRNGEMTASVGTYVDKADAKPAATGTWTSEFSSGESTVTFTTHNKARITQADVTYVEVVAVTGNAYNWITFCNGSALDFTGSDVTAYVVTGTSGTALEKTEVGAVAANTPLMINATAGTHYVKKAATGTDYSATNCLKQGEDAAVDAEGGKSRYILTLRDGKAAFAIIDNEYSPTVPSDKAYLEIEDGGAGAARSFFFLDDEGETTSLNEVRGLKAEVRGDFYDLSGRKVAQPTKGLYIVNGRKVVIK